MAVGILVFSSRLLVCLLPCDRVIITTMRLSRFDCYRFDYRSDCDRLNFFGRTFWVVVSRYLSLRLHSEKKQVSNFVKLRQ